MGKAAAAGIGDDVNCQNSTTETSWKDTNNLHSCLGWCIAR